MKWITFSIVLCVQLSEALPQILPDSNAYFNQRFMMDEYIDGKKVEKSFRIWHLSGFLDVVGSNGSPYCQLLETVFAISEDPLTKLSRNDSVTHVLAFAREASSVKNQGDGVFLITFDREGSFLEVVIRFNNNRSKVYDIYGSFLTIDESGQARHEFKVNRGFLNRRIPPVTNPSWWLRKE